MWSIGIYTGASPLDLGPANGVVNPILTSASVHDVPARFVADPFIFRREDKWWMLACTTPYSHDTLRLYFADELFGPWREHPANPIVSGNKHNARPAGRVLTLDGKLIRFSQDCVPVYGTQVRAFEIQQLTATSYVEEEVRTGPILVASGAGWNAVGMHHVDAHLCEDGSWIACVDGRAG